MITRIELVYLYSVHEEFIAPYYRFWVRTDRDNNDHITSYEGIDYYYYTPFDIPAVRTSN